MSSQRWASACALLTVLVYFWLHTWWSLWSGFSHDDLMNTYFAWREPPGKWVQANVVYFSDAIRPLGALFYTVFFRLFGFDPFPFRVACMVVLTANAALAFWFARALTGSLWLGAATAAAHCYHVNLYALYEGSGNCYDVFAFFFYFAALCWYVAIRNRARVPNARESLALCLLYIAAMNSKEAGVSLPAALLLYEIFYQRVGLSVAWLKTGGRSVVLTGLVGLIYVAGKLTSEKSIASMEAYQISISLASYLRATAVYLNDIVYSNDRFAFPGAGVLLAFLLLLAVATRNRHLIFSWLFIVITAAPMAFIPPRGLASLYIPFFGYALFVVVCVAALGRICLEAFPRLATLNRTALRAAALTAWILLLSAIHMRYGVLNREPVWKQTRLIAAVADDFKRHPDWFRKDAKILILSDPFDERWASTFLVYLVGREPSVRVDRLPDMNPQPRLEQIATEYGVVLALRGGRMVRVPANAVPSDQLSR